MADEVLELVECEQIRPVRYRWEGVCSFDVSIDGRAIPYRPSLGAFEIGPETMGLLVRQAQAAVQLRKELHRAYTDMIDYPSGLSREAARVREVLDRYVLPAQKPEVPLGTRRESPGGPQVYVKFGEAPKPCEHEWGDWRISGTYDVSYPDKPTEHYVVEMRCCQKCGVAQRQVMKVEDGPKG